MHAELHSQEMSPKLKELSYKITIALLQVRLLVQVHMWSFPRLKHWNLLRISLVGERSGSNLKSLCTTETYLTAGSWFKYSALKDGTTKGVIEGLLRSGDFYSEAIENLRSRYYRPRLPHPTHVKIIDTPALKDCNGKQVHHLYDTV